MSLQRSPVPPSMALNFLPSMKTRLQENSLNISKRAKEVMRIYGFRLNQESKVYLKRLRDTNLKKIKGDSPEDLVDITIDVLEIYKENLISDGELDSQFEIERFETLDDDGVTIAIEDTDDFDKRLLRFPRRGFDDTKDNPERIAESVIENRFPFPFKVKGLRKLKKFFFG